MLKPCCFLCPGRWSVLTGALLIAFFSADQLIAGPRWHRDYYEAVTAAKKQKKMLLVFAHAKVDNAKGDKSKGEKSKGDNAPRDQFRTKTLSDPKIAKLLRGFVLVELPLDVQIKSDNRRIALFEHESFAPLAGRQGLAIIDYAHKDTPHFGHVVSAFPFPSKGPLDVSTTALILNLPPGTITQRTLIYAVRIHNEQPASTVGKLHVALRTAVEQHSQHQADITLQGHHNWEARFHQINAKLPKGMISTEVCAESWPGKGPIAAAIDCVHSWRQSSGHWRAVSGRHAVYAYDMKRGSNGIWYATGIFGNRR